MLVDSHAHLDASQFAGDLAPVLESARAAGVTDIVSVGLDVESSRRARDIAVKHEFVHFAAGLHPSKCDQFDTERDDLRAFIESEAPCAIGEIGLDYFRDPSDRGTQRRVFRDQLSWAAELNLPVIVHDRDAHEDVIADLAEYGVRGVLHCFSGSVELAEMAVAMGLYVSFAGNVTYKSAIELQTVARSIPGEKLLVETDSPYLPPEGFRGQRNEPARVRDVACFISELRGWSLEHTAQTTGNNAKRLFGWE